MILIILKNLLFEYYFKEREKGKQQSRDHEETKRQIEEDADEEIVKLMQTHEQQLIACKEENSNLKNKSTTFQRKVRLKQPKRISLNSNHFSIKG
jgi:hypothetical protein